VACYLVKQLNGNKSRGWEALHCQEYSCKYAAQKQYDYSRVRFSAARDVVQPKYKEV
jgi:hypothetical protein